ncbi:MAG: Nif3-like dinuclear metal center hexameric protein [Mycoplasmatales bacterium]
MKLYELINTLDFFYPTHISEDWDNVGLQLGGSNKEVNRILTALEITDEVVDEAIEKKIDVIVVHHPVIFKPLKTLATNSISNRRIVRLIKADIAVYVVHTNADIANNGMNDWLAEIIGLNKQFVLAPSVPIKLNNIQIELSESNVEDIINIMRLIGAGHTSKNLVEVYMYPKIKLEKTNENEESEHDVIILEANLSDEQEILLKKKLSIYNKKTKKRVCFISNQLNSNRTMLGIGRYGQIKPKTLEHFAKDLKKKFGLDHLKITGDLEKIISRVAVVGGAGCDYLEAARQNKCDVLVTGDVKFHDARAALDLGIALIDIGHVAELVFNDAMADFINMISEDITAISSEVDPDPFEVI